MLWYHGSQQHHPSGNRALKQWLALVGSSPLKGSEISVVRPKQRLKERKEGRGRGKKRERKTSVECGKGIISRNLCFGCMCATFLKCIFIVEYSTKIWGGAALKQLLVA